MAKYFEKKFNDSARNSMDNSSDTITWKILADSSSKYFGICHQIKEKLQAVEFSMDSLSKMK